MKRSIKNEYPIGTRIELELMEDMPTMMPKGLRGIITGYENQAFTVDWDNGSFLLLYPNDIFRTLTPEEIAVEQTEQSEDGGMSLQ
jgi:hypothetical protein